MAGDQVSASIRTDPTNVQMAAEIDRLKHQLADSRFADELHPGLNVFPVKVIFRALGANVRQESSSGESVLDQTTPSSKST